MVADASPDGVRKFHNSRSASVRSSRIHVETARVRSVTGANDAGEYSRSRNGNSGCDHCSILLKSAATSDVENLKDPMPFCYDIPVVKEEFRKEVVDNLWKSGFGSELKAIKVFSEREGWGTVTTGSFFDPIAKVSRELDFTAHKHRFRRKEPDGDFLFNVTVSLIAEVKKSEKPWAVLRGPPWKTPQLPFLMNALVRTSQSDLASEIKEALAKGCVIAVNKWFGHAVHEVFKKPDDHGRWFTSAAKTSRAALAASGRPFQKLMGEPWMIRYVQPLVVLDGNLLAVSLDKSNEMVVDEIRFASVRFEEQEGNITHSSVVDIVTLEALSSYIDQLDVGFEECFRLLAARRR
jgi:hypothetical protein